ncbi:MAG: molecular chaperone DnaJ [Thermoanaerobacteraceae bacterium]|nr:molecular chaperone DnaJ [Thermoanaerobacteraceae bacterium]
MADKDYYEILGVSKDATVEDIKKAYRNLAKKYHPDLHPGDKEAEQRFKEINEAYEVLSDPDKRAQYDRFGSSAFNGHGFNPGDFGGFDFGGFGGNPFNDIFDMFFGEDFMGRRRETGPVRGRDLKEELVLTFEEAAFGTEKTLNVTRWEICPVCHGTKARPGSSPQTCPQCGGTGQVRNVRQTPLGSMTTITSCPRCHGEGRIITEPCTECKGAGKVKKTRKVTVKVPAGVDDGHIITLRGEGEPGEKGGPPGDLFLSITVKPHPIFKRDGFDVLANLKISMFKAALGGEVEIPTLDGTIKYNLPEGIQPGEKIRLKGKGINKLKGYGRGDEIVTVEVTIPRLNERQKQILREIETGEINRDKEEKSFFQKMKDTFGGA